MTVHEPAAEDELAAGGFSSWLRGVQGALAGEGGSDVPCDGCTACCTSSQFVHVAPDEVETLSRIPSALLFPAPNLPPGHVVLGYDERGSCPMLIDGRCSIYEQRPRTCRTYDCRIFPAAGLEVGDRSKISIARRSRRWRFSFPSPTDRAERDAVRAAATFLSSHPDVLPDSVPRTTTQLAVLAVMIHDVFLGRAGGTGRPTPVTPDPEALRLELAHRTGAAGRGTG